MISFGSRCPICDLKNDFHAEDDFWHGRGGLTSPTCPYNICITRERALATVVFTFFEKDEVKRLHIHEAAPSLRGLSMWLVENCKNYTASGYFKDKPFGSIVSKMRNEDLEHQTFPDASFDLVLHLDVMEHLFDPFQALREIYRTLKPDGRCIFTAPTYWDRLKSEQAALLKPDGRVEILGEPEYHGNPQNKDGSLVTWRYGYDLPVLISRQTQFDVEVRRFQSKKACAVGVMNEVYILSK